MDVAGLSHERGARSGAARRSTSARDRRALRPHTSMVRPEPAHVSQGSSPSALPLDRRAGDVDPAATVADTADHLQADYFMRLLIQSRRLVDHRIDEYQKAIATAETNGDVDAADSFRRMTRIEEQDRQILDHMIEKLRRRFPRRAQGEAPTISPRTRFVVR